jgi:hypothetical protein
MISFSKGVFRRKKKRVGKRRARWKRRKTHSRCTILGSNCRIVCREREKKREKKVSIMEFITIRIEGRGKKDIRDSSL